MYKRQSEVQRSNVVLSCSSDVIVISLHFTAMDSELVDADQILNEFYLLREQIKIIFLFQFYFIYISAEIVLKL